jgi:molybdopterin/thiamine biosynthesis adenylyltransferase
MIREAMKAIAERRPGRTKLVYDKTRRTIVAVAENAQVPRALNITAEDADMFAVVTLSAQWLRGEWDRLTRDGTVGLRLSEWDKGDAYSQCDLGVQPAPAVVEGAVMFNGARIPSESPTVRVVLSKETTAEDTSGPAMLVAPDGLTYRARAWRNVDGRDEPIAVHVADIQPDLAVRRAGLLESKVLKDRSVLCIGLGTGGAHAAIELAKCGVGSFVLVDPDRLTVGNVVRHPGGISQVGRLKVNVVRDQLLEKNPEIEISTHPLTAAAENETLITRLIEHADIVLCGTDNRPSKLLVNRLCIQANVVAVYGGAFRRAYGGQVLRVRPKESPCHQCFISAMPEQANDVEISSESAASAIAYSDRPVVPEPGLSLDVLPIANMLAKLALLELLRDKESSLNVLQRDFDAPWYLWLNRPEPGTSYATLPPLSESSDAMTINRWYGVYFDREVGCSACGDFLSTVAAAYGLDMASLTPPPANAS